MCEIPADAGFFDLDVIGGLGRAPELVVEAGLFVDIVADGLNLLPAGCLEPEHVPCDIPELVGFAIAAWREELQGFDRKLVDRGQPCV